MKSIVRLALVSLLTTSVAHGAANEELKKLDENQAVLTRQLNFGEKVADAHGRYVILRDQYVLGNAGLLKLGETFNTNIATWLQKWQQILQPLATSAWVETVQSAAFQQSIDKQNADLEKLAELSKRFEGTIKTGLRLSKELPNLDVLEFKRMKQGASAPVVFLDAYEPSFQYINQQFATMQTIFAESDKALAVQMIPSLRDFSFNLTNKLKLITVSKRLSFPELKAQLQAVEKMLGTMEQLNPIQGFFTNSYTKGLQLIAANQLPEIEALIKDLESHQSRDFVPYEGKPIYDQDRVNQGKALVQMQLNDLKTNLRNAVNAAGGRKEMLGSYIRVQSTRGANSPLTVCRSTTSTARIQYDCNLFRAQVVPFLPRLRELDEPVLGQIVKTLQQVYQGPLATETQP